MTEDSTLSSRMHTYKVDNLRPNDIEKAVSTMVLAFAADPGARWFSPTAELYMQNMTGYARATVTPAISHDAAFQIGDGLGVVFCLPPGVDVGEATLSEALTPRFPDADQISMRVLAKKSIEIRPDEAHWYLPMMGVDPVCQRLGLGAQLMKTVCEHFDRDGLPAFLESSNPKNLSLYRRFGFEVLQDVQEGTSPTITLMWREPGPT